MFALYDVDPKVFENNFESWRKTVHPDDLERVEKAFNEAVSSNQPFDSEFRVVWRDGTIHYLQTSIVIEHDAKGEALQVLGSNWDVTQSKRMVKALQDSEKDYRQLFENMTVGFLMLHVEKDGAGIPTSYRIVQVNPAAEKLMGKPRREMIGQSMKDCFSPMEPYWGNVFAKVARTGQPASYENHAKSLGMVLSIWVFEPKPDHLAVVFSDNTARWKAEDSVLQAQQQLQHVVNNIKDVIFRIDLKGNYTYVNATATELTGYSSEELLSMNMMELVAPEYCAMITDRIALRVSGSPEQSNSSFEIIHKKGRRVWVELASRGVFDSLGQLEGIQGVARDITKRRKMEAELRKLSAAIEQSADAVVITDTNGIIEYVNPAFESSTGYSREEALGQNPRILKSGKHPDAFYTQIWEMLANGKVWQGRMINKRKEGTFYTEEVTFSPVTDVSGKVVNYVAVKHDVTDELEMEAHFQQVQKMDAVGRLAGGVAHDFNNILQTILGFSGILLEEMEPGTDQYADVEEISHAARRAGELTQQLLIFSRKQDMVEYTKQDLNEIVKRSERMMRRLLGEQVQFVLKLQPSLKSVRVDASQIEQILLNLFVNARDAMPDGGDLVVITSLSSVDEEHATSAGGDHTGEYACLTVSDTGCGIDEDVQKHLFEPFFTTKEVGKGTGLGLSVVYGIVEQHGGWIEVSSELGEGSTFNVYLPVCEQDDSGDPLYETHDELPKWLGGGGEEILVVEDDPVVRDLIVRILANASYRVESAENATQALQRWEKHENGFDLLYCDIVLPDQSGFELADEFRRHNGNLPVVLCSGYSTNPKQLDQARNAGFQFLEKPVSAVKLLRTVRELLDKRPAS